MDAVAAMFEGLARGVAHALPRLEAARRYDPAKATRALDMLVAQLAGYAIGLVSASAASALARGAAPARAAAIRDELAKIAAEPGPRRRPTPPPDLDRELAGPPPITANELAIRLHERLHTARAEATAIVARLAAVACDDRGLAALHRDDLAPYRFGERIEAGWSALCDELADGRAPARPTPVPPAAAELVENYCWMRIR
jgi:hypothetical protein